jgi:hypothetical protein
VTGIGYPSKFSSIIEVIWQHKMSPRVFCETSGVDLRSLAPMVRTQVRKESHGVEAKIYFTPARTDREASSIKPPCDRWKRR